MKSLIKKVLPQSVIKKLITLKEKNLSPELRRARTIGLNSKQYKEFILDENAASNTHELFIFGAMKKTKFLKESKAFLMESIFDDAYQLEKINIPRDQHCKIIDIGANVGAFAIAARTHFPRATIHCYEPHPSLEEFLKLQAYAVGAKYYMEGVGFEEGFFASDEMQNEILQSESVKIMDFTKKGDIKISSLKTVIERIGGYVDILKLDCEGSEWNILKDKDALQKVNYLTVEFHRISPDKSFDIYDRSIDIHKKAKETISSLGFTILVERYHSVDAGIILAQRNIN